MKVRIKKEWSRLTERYWFHVQTRFMFIWFTKDYFASLEKAELFAEEIINGHLGSVVKEYEKK